MYRHQEKPHRKDLKQVSERQHKQYFFLIRLLQIFAPLKNQYYKLIFNEFPVTPKCMYDSLISMHSSCCQHETTYFVYWHQALLLKFEEYLLKAHQKILNHSELLSEKSRLADLIKKGSTKDFCPHEVGVLLNKIHQDYKNILGTGCQKQKVHYIPAHYWNLFDYENQISFPEGFVSVGKYAETFKNIDELIRLVWDQDSIYEINLETRFGYTKPILQQKAKLPIYDDFDKLLKNTAFWKDPRCQPELLQTATKFASNEKKIRQDYWNYKLYEKRRSSSCKDSHKLRFNVMDTQMVSYVFGGKGFNHIKINENDTPAFKRFAQTRNNGITYYTYARSLLTKPEDYKKFLTISHSSLHFSMENSHDQAHDDQAYIMNHPNYSTTNPLFFAYHSFIDLLLENRITTFSPEDSAEAADALEYFLEKEQIEAKPNTFKAKFFSELGKTKNSDYPVMIWTNPNWKQNLLKPFCENYSSSSNFTYRELFLKQGRLTTLKNLLDITYDVSEPFKKTLEYVGPDLKDPYSVKSLFVAVDVKWKATIESQTLNVELTDKDGQAITSQIIPIFSKGDNSVSCPNCPLYIKRRLLFPIEDIEKYYPNIFQIRANGSCTTDVCSNVEPLRPLSQIILPKLDNPEVICKLTTGRRTVKIVLENTDNYSCVDPASVKIYLTVEYIDPTKALLTSEIKKSHKLTFGKQGEIIVDGKDVFTITDITAQIGENRTINYTFPLYTEFSEVRVDLSTKEKFGLAAKTLIGQQANNLTERPIGFTNLVNLSKSSRPLKQNQRIVRATGTSHPIQIKVLGNSDFQ